MSRGGPGMRVQVDVLSAKAIKQLGATEHRAEYLEPVLRVSARVLGEGLTRNFQTRGSFFGSPWPAKKDGSPATLNRTGALQSSVAGLTRTTKAQAIAGFSGPEAFIARFHQAGTSRGLPARPLVGHADITRTRLIDMLERYLVDGDLR